MVISLICLLLIHSIRCNVKSKCQYSYAIVGDLNAYILQCCCMQQKLKILRNFTKFHTARYTFSMNHFVRNSRLVAWLHNLGQLVIFEQGHLAVTICSPLQDFSNTRPQPAELLYMGFDRHAFTMAFTFLAQAHHTYPFTQMDPLNFIWVLAYFQPYEFPLNIWVSMLHSIPVRQWAKIFFLLRTYFPNDKMAIKVIENYNLWHVHIPIDKLNKVWTRPCLLQQVACGA